MKLIPLTQGKFAMVDDSDFESLNRFKWYAHRSKKTFYARRAVSLGGGKQRWETMHQLLLGRNIDHIDRDGLNNQRSNLRFATNHQQMANRGLFKNNTSGFRGVTWHCGKWVAQIGAGGVVRYLGQFLNPVAAARAYDAAANKHFGEFARLNFPSTKV